MKPEFFAKGIGNFISVIKNKKSGKFFIYLDDIADNKVKVIMQNGSISILNSKLFDEVEEISEINILKNNLLTDSQINSYLNELNKIENTNNYTISEEKLFCKNNDEPLYKNTYRKMLRNSDTMVSIMLEIVQQHRKIEWVNLIGILCDNHNYSGTGGSLGASLKVLVDDGYVEVDGTGSSKIISII